MKASMKKLVLILLILGLIFGNGGVTAAPPTDFSITTGGVLPTFIGDLTLSPGNIVFTVEPAPSAPTAALITTASGNCTNGAHLVKITFVTATGETTAGTASGSVTVDGTHKQIAVTAIPKGSAAITGRNVYMTKAGGSTYYLVATSPVIANNTVTTYTINVADTSLTVVAPTVNTTAGKLTNFNFIDSTLWGTLPAGDGYLLTASMAGVLSYTNPAGIGGVTSFNTRTGAVVPVVGDYNTLAITSLPTTGTWSDATTYVGTAGAGGLVAYNLAYISADNTYLKTLASSTATMPCVAMATANINAAATGVLLKSGFITNSGWAWTAPYNKLLYADRTTAGLITETAPSTVGDQAQVVGITINATTIWFNPSLVVVTVGTGPLGYSAYGTAYTLTATPALCTGATITIAQAGTYTLYAQATADLVGATFAANRVITLKIRRTNNTPADLATAPVITTPIITALTYTLGFYQVPVAVYVATAGDILETWGSIDVVPSAGSITATGSIVAVKIQ